MSGTKEEAIEGAKNKVCSLHSEPVAIPWVRSALVGEAIKGNEIEIHSFSFFSTTSWKKETEMNET